MEQGVKHYSSVELDEWLERLHPLRDIAVPPEGWIRVLREAMGMSVQQLADRSGLPVVAIEQLEYISSVPGGSFAELRRLADALHCSFIWGLIPHQSLSNLLRERAAAVAQKRLREVADMMRREGRNMSTDEVELHVRKFSEVLLNELPSGLWDLNHDPLAPPAYDAHFPP